MNTNPSPAGSTGLPPAGKAHDARNFDCVASLAIALAKARLAAGDLWKAIHHLNTAERALHLAGAVRHEPTAVPSSTDPLERQAEFLEILGLAAPLLDGFELTVRDGPTLAETTIGPVPFARIVTNFAKNVADHASPGPVLLACGEVVFDHPQFFATPPNAICAGRYLELSITDSGPGIPRDVLLNLPRASTKAGPHHGHGIRNILDLAREADGGLSILSTEGGPTRVSVYLPAPIRQPA